MSDIANNSGGERRRYPRVALVQELQYEVEGGRYRRRLTEIGEGGMFIDTDNPSPPGSIITVRFRLPGSNDFIAATAEVRYAQERIGMGVRFLDLKPEDRAKIREFVERVSSQRKPLSQELRSSRVIVKIPVTLKGTERDGTAFQEQASIVTLSKNGACVLTNRDLDVGMMVQLSAPNGLKSEARVVWVGDEATKTKGQIGIQCRGLAQALGVHFP